jgi:hypothetical protein
MDKISRDILIKSGIQFENENILIEMLIPRESFIDESSSIYNSIKSTIPELKSILSSSSLTSLQKPAETNQKWPLLNLVRQILNVYGFQMKPIRKSDGYTKDGVKKFKRYFFITKKKQNTSENQCQSNNETDIQ